jgi:dihydrofolate reductase
MIHAIFAIDQFGGMGLNGTLPWPHNSTDLSNFKKLTTGHVVVMGRKSWDDPKMPKPLKGRTVYVATNRSVDHAVPIKGDLVHEILNLEQQHPNQIIWIAGGPNLLEQCKDIIDRVHLTYVHGSYKIDTKLDKSYMSGWRISGATGMPNSNCTFTIYDRIFKRATTNP